MYYFKRGKSNMVADGDGREITGIVEDTKLPHDVTLS